MCHDLQLSSLLWVLNGIFALIFASSDKIVACTLGFSTSIDHEVIATRRQSRLMKSSDEVVVPTLGFSMMVFIYLFENLYGDVITTEALPWQATGLRAVLLSA
jgi:hypothetical protein